MKRWPAVGVALAGLWLFLRGVKLTPQRLGATFVIGLSVGIPVAYLTRRLYSEEVDLWRTIQAAPYALLYAIIFIRDVIIANIDVAWRILAPSLPIQPTVIVFPLRVQTDLGITLIANSITLTPGTLTMEYDETRHALIIHSMTTDDPDAITGPIRQWEEYALVIFDEELKPGDPVPNWEGGSDGDE